VFYYVLKYVILGPLLRLVFRPKIEGLEHVPASGAAIVAGNHLSFSDSIFLPLCVPALSVVALFRFLWAWNDYLGPLIYLNQENLLPLALGIDRLRQTISSTGAQVLAYPYLMAVSTIVVAPVLLLFFFAQRTFIEGISVTVCRKSRSMITRLRTGDVAVTVAVRGAFVSSAISPNQSPGPSSATLRPPLSTREVPSITTKNS